VGMLRPVVAPLAQLDDAAAADVGVAIHLANPRAVALDVVDDQPLAKRQIAQGDFFGPTVGCDCTLI
jgi:hypothetical protein